MATKLETLTRQTQTAGASLVATPKGGGSASLGIAGGSPPAGAEKAKRDAYDVSKHLSLLEALTVISNAITTSKTITIVSDTSVVDEILRELKMMNMHLSLITEVSLERGDI